MAEAVAAKPVAKVMGLSHIAQGSPNVRRLANFYKEIFGFEEVPELGDASKVRFLNLPSNNFSIHLIERDSTTKLPEGPWTFESRDLSHIRFGHHFCLTVSNFELVMQTLKEKGIEAFESPVSNPKMRQAFLFDPDGNGMEIVSLGTREMLRKIAISQ